MVARLLYEVPAGQICRIKALQASGILRRRLLDLGFVPGASVAVVRRAPWGDPTAYRVRGALIALRREEAAYIVVEEGKEETLC